jgi:hypothetical protein
MSFIPLHLSALDRSEGLRGWLCGWLPGTPIFLTPYDWFQRGHGITGYIKNFEGNSVPIFAQTSVLVWSPPPYAADVAIAELRKSLHKRPSHLHVFVCPRLCSPLWRRHLFRACDIIFDMAPGQSFWPGAMHEPLLIGLVFPFIRHPPWQLRGTPRMLQVVRDVRRMWKVDRMDAGPFLREFCLQCTRLQTMPKDMVRRMLYFEPGAKVPRGGEVGRDPQ